MKLRSQIRRFGVAQVTKKSKLYGMGYTDSEITKPHIAIINSWNELNPGHRNLKILAKRVKEGIIASGGFPIELVTTGICDAFPQKDPKYIEVPSRNLIADEVELNVEGNFMDAMVMLCTCDSIVPGMLMAAARLDIPTIVLTGGYMPMSTHKGKEVICSTLLDSVGKYESGEISKEEIDSMTANYYGPCGACGVLSTGNSMCIISEAMGMSLPGNASLSATSSKILSLAYRAGTQIVELIKKGITARDIITEESIKNAIKTDMAIAGSTNLLLHIPAIAQEAGLDKDWWKEFEKFSNEIPLLLNIHPNGPYHFKHFDMAGGSKALFKKLLPKLNGDVLTVTSKKLSDNLINVAVYNDKIIRNLDNPIMSKGGISILYGNIAKEGAIVKTAAVPEKLFKFEGPAKVFETVNGAIGALKNKKINKGDAIIIRGQGLKGRFGTAVFTFQDELKGMSELYNSCAIITDGRFSGVTSGLSIGYVSPEAALGGALAVVKENDIIEIDIDKRKVNIRVSEDEIKNRFKNWKWNPKKENFPTFLRLFLKNVSSAAKGGVWEV